MEKVAFSKKEEAAKTINTFIEKETKDKIKNMINADSIDENVSPERKLAITVCLSDSRHARQCRLLPRKLEG